jgi:voltage-gated potassium channel
MVRRGYKASRPLTTGQSVLRRLALSGAIFFGVLVLGALGYRLIEGWSLLDSLYMTVTTISTVGFGELHPLSAAGRVFTMILIVCGVGTLGFAFASFVDFLVEGHLLGLLEDRRMNRDIAQLSAHAIVTGIGRVGFEVARSFAREDSPFVVVDADPDAIQRARDEGWLFVEGDATQEGVLENAGVARARSLVAALDSDAENVFVVLTARTTNPGIFIVARAMTPATEDRLRKAGADRVTTPSVIGGRRMASLVLHPLVSDYLDLVTHGDDFEFQLEEFVLTAQGRVAGKTIADARLHDDFGMFVLAVRHNDGAIEAKPTAETVLHAGDRVVLLGTGDQFEAVEGIL